MAVNVDGDRECMHGIKD